MSGKTASLLSTAATTDIGAAAAAIDNLPNEAERSNSGDEIRIAGAHVLSIVIYFEVDDNLPLENNP